MTPGMPRFMSLRTKFVLFFSLILILTSSTLSWYLIENRRQAMAGNLRQLGSILLTNVVSNEHFRFAGVVAQDHATLQQFVDGLMALQDVVYVVVTGPEGKVLSEATKGARQSATSLTRVPTDPLYPDSLVARELLKSPVSSPQMTLLSKVNRVSTRFAWEEHVYDFALPVLRAARDNKLDPLALFMEEGGARHSPADQVIVSGVVQIGLSDARLQHELVTMITNVVLLTVIIIFAGILGAHLLGSRITTPLRSLAAVALEVAGDRLPQPLTPSTHDEVGQLTHMFNQMTKALHERNTAITANMDTIRRQISQLSAIHKTSAALTSMLDLNELMDTVLQLLMTNLGFTRMVLMLRHEDEDVAYVAQVAGVSDEIAEAARLLTVPIKDDGTIVAQLFLHAKPLLVGNISDVAHRMHPAIYELTKRVGVKSFVLVPLQTHNRTLGFLGGNRGEQTCTEDDLDILMTIASHVATGIDNARAYANLARLTQTLEFRIQQRTQELSIANEQLRDHDRRRTMFVSVASHELRTPMTAIRSFADNMLDGVAGALTERQTTYLNRIGHNLNRLTRIINQLLDWSRLDMKKEILRLESLGISEIATLVVESLRPVAAEKGVALDMDLPAEVPMVRGDRDKLEQILWNIVGNAVKFTQQGGRVTVGFETISENMAQICVADTGCGIPSEHLDRLFEDFSKIPSAMPSSQGAQLGLFITKSFVELHKGRIWAESELGVGTQVFFTMPLAPIATQPDHSPQIVTPGSTGGAT